MRRFSCRMANAPKKASAKEFGASTDTHTYARQPPYLDVVHIPVQHRHGAFEVSMQNKRLVSMGKMCRWQTTECVERKLKMRTEKMRNTLKRLPAEKITVVLPLYECFPLILPLCHFHLLLLHSFVLSARKTQFNCRIVERRRHKILLINDFHSTFGETADSQDNSPIKCVATWICAAAQRRASTSILLMKWGTMRVVVCTWYKRSLDFHYRIDGAVTLSPLSRPNEMKISQVIFDTERWLPSQYNSFQFCVTTCF